MQKWPEEAIQIIKQLQQENQELKEKIRSDYINRYLKEADFEQYFMKEG